jgi:hypothetical protein
MIETGGSFCRTFFLPLLAEASMTDQPFEQRLSAVEERLAIIERLLKTSAAAPVPPRPAPITTPISIDPPTSIADDFSDDFADAPLASGKYRTAQAPEQPGNWLGIMAVICFVVAAAFIIKLSIDSGWLTPARQIGMAALLGFGLVGAGLALAKSDRSYASLLPSAGVIVLYMSSFAAHRYYGLISFEAALAASFCVSGLCIWLHTRIRHDIYPLTAAVGAYLSPVILGLHADAAFTIYYFLICSVAFAALSIWMQSRVLTMVSAYLAIGQTGAIGTDLHMYSFSAAMLGLEFLVLSVGSYTFSWHASKAMSEGEAWCFFPVLLIFYAFEYNFIDQIAPVYAPHLAAWASLGFAGFLLGLYAVAKRYFHNGNNGGIASGMPVTAFATLVCFHSVYLVLMPEDARPWLLPAMLAVMAFTPAALGARLSRLAIIPGIALLAIALIEYLSIAEHIVDNEAGPWLALGFATLGMLWAMVAAKAKAYGANVATALLAAAHPLALLALYRLASDTGSLAVSALWLFYAVAVLIFSVARKDETMAQSALFILVFAAGKALLYDAASAPTVIRILCLLLTGVVLYGCGLLMRRAASWKKS